MMNGSPEGRLVGRWVVLALLFGIGAILGPHANENGHLIVAIYIASIMSARVFVVTPTRYAWRKGPRTLRIIWYAFLTEMGLLGTAFALAINDSDYSLAAWVVLAIAIGIEVTISRVQPREHRRLAITVPTLKSFAAGANVIFTAEGWGGHNDEFRRILSQVFVSIPTVIRAYLVMANYQGEPNLRILALRFAFPWSDDDAIRAAEVVLSHVFPQNEKLMTIMLNDQSERRVLEVAQPFYQRPTPRAPAAEPTQ